MSHVPDVTLYPGNVLLLSHTNLSVADLKDTVSRCLRRSTNSSLEHTQCHTLGLRPETKTFRNDTERGKEQTRQSEEYGLKNWQLKNCKAGAAVSPPPLLKPTWVSYLFLPLTYKGSVIGKTSGEQSKGGQEEKQREEREGKAC